MSALRWARGDPTAEGSTPPVICTVTTLLDTLPNVRAFVSRNLAAGADHMFVFLDGPSPEVREFLDAHEHVTVIRTGKDYWQGHRPPALNRRQSMNANLVNCLLAPFEAAAWLFHIDGDECLDLDRAYLDGLGPEVPCVRLGTWEAVSEEQPQAEVTLFKRPLREEELALLAVLGVIEKAHNRFLFNGHLNGKTGMRPDLGVRLRIHFIVDHDGEEIQGAHPGDQHLLHYESFSGEEFVRKWEAHLASGARPKFNARRDRLRAAIEGVVGNGHLDGERKQELLLDLYRREVRDDVATLESLGYLESPDPARHRHRPSGFEPEDRVLLTRYLELLHEVDKRAFWPGPDNPVSPDAVVRGVLGSLGPGETDLARLLERLLSASRP